MTSGKLMFVKQSTSSLLDHIERFVDENMKGKEEGGTCAELRHAIYFLRDHIDQITEEDLIP